jgi:hypothetical protein
MVFGTFWRAARMYLGSLSLEYLLTKVLIIWSTFSPGDKIPEFT